MDADLEAVIARAEGAARLLCQTGDATWRRHLSDLGKLRAALSAGQADVRRLDYIERTFSGMTNRERYLPVQMIWGKGCNGRTLREACDKYMKRDAAIAATGESHGLCD